MLVLSNSIDYRDIGLTIYRDDSLFYKFYLFPDAPRVRKDSTGHPVFLLTKYAFSDRDREKHPELDGGGFLNLDVVFAATPEQEAEARTRLQALVEKEWNRTRGINSASEGYQYSGPDVELGTPQWTDGSVSFEVVNDPNLVAGKLSEGKPSMFGANNAIFNATLTTAGATYFQKALVTDNGTGVNLAPISVKYTLKFMRRLPPARIQIYGNVTQIYDAVSQLSHDYDSHCWREDDFTTNESYSEYLLNSQAVYVRIDTGEYQADDDSMEELRSFAMGQLTKWLQENLFEKLNKFDPSYPDVADVYTKEEDVYRMKKIHQVASSTLMINIEQTGLVEQTVNPQATLESFFEGMPPEEIAKHVREIDLDDNFFKTLDLHVKAFADYKEIQYVKVDLQYDGETGLKVQSFSFESDDDEAGYWDPRLFDGKRDYRYRYEVAFKSNPAAKILSDWIPETTRQLNLNIGRPGELALDILAGQIDWENLVEQVQVTVSYEDTRHQIEKESATLILDKTSPSKAYQRWLYRFREEPVVYQAKYFLKNGQEFATNLANTTDRQIIVNDTFVDALSVMVVPSGKVEAINQVVVDCRYQDRTGYSVIKSFSIAKPDFLGTWKVPLIEPNYEKWEYKTLVMYKDGTFTESLWKPMEGSQTVAIAWPSPPSLNVILNPSLLKFEPGTVVEVTLTYKGEVVEGDSPATFIFETKAPQTWNLRVKSEAVKDFDYEITYYLPTDTVTKRGTTAKEAFLIPRPTP